MRGTRWLGILLVGCVGDGGGPGGRGGGGGGGGAEDSAGVEDTGADTDTAAIAEPPVVVTVCGDGSADHLTPQAAIDAAPDGAVLELCGETFPENVVIDGRTLTLHGAPGATLDGGGTARALEVRSTTAPA